MSDVKVATRYVHVPGGVEGVTVFKPGDIIPAEFADQVTNPGAFEVLADATATPVTATGAPSGDGGGDAPPPATEQSTEVPEADLPYDERKFASLQAVAKARGLSGAGKAEELVARLEADDREKANTAPTRQE